MAKTKTAKTTKKAVEATETEALKATAMLRKGALAYVGLYGAAFERAKMRTEQVRSFYNTKTDGVFDTLVAKGEEIEGKAADYAKTAQKRVVETFETTTDKVKEILPTASNDRVEELEAEIATLNKKISAMAKKNAKPAKKTEMKTEKSVKAA
ncbi:hypothetical protein ACJ3XI_02550 [Litorimonas sp. RW-G-Af-16]|uniref:hypothetical protein n=1 Tax=Litorimonas sp. RW-G-Af-16 TaxID=3241168 RepID=UPI00390C5A27